MNTPTFVLAVAATVLSSLRDVWCLGVTANGMPR